MRKIDRVYIHCSAGPRGNLKYIEGLHTDPKPKGKGWSRIGYHFVIGNGFPDYPSWKAQNYQKQHDGKLWIGLPLDTQGIHVKGDNQTSVGICLIGKNRFTLKQFNTLVVLSKKLVLSKGISPQMFLGHREYWILRGRPTLKTCPTFDMNWFRGYLLTMLQGRC